MKILLINPKSLGKTIYSPWIQLGLAHISSYLKEHGYTKIKGIDMSMLQDWSQFEHEIKNFDPDVVGIHVNTVNYNNALKVAKKVKSINSKIIINVGGPHPTIFPKDVLKEKYFDVSVFGEGEITFLEFIQAIEKGYDLENIRGLCYKKDNKIIQNKERPPIENINMLPFPDRDLFNIKEILKIPPNYPQYCSYPFTDMLTSRGCPFNCKFCQPTERWRDVDNVIEEVDFLIEKYKLKHIMFSDDTFTIKKEWLKRLASELKRRDITWECQSRADSINDDVAKILKKSGCILLNFGIESGSSRILNFLNKGTTPQQNKDALKLCRKTKLLSWANVLIGVPGETLTDIEQTDRLLNETKPDFISASMLSPIPGTYLYDWAKERNLIMVKDKHWEVFDRGNPKEKLKLNIDIKTIHYYQKRWQRNNFKLDPYFIKNDYYRSSIYQRMKSHIKERHFKALLYQLLGMVL